MKKPLIAVVSFPGNNCEVESVRAVRKAGMDALYFRWNDDRSKLEEVDGYFIPGGFSYEDRGRSGMVAGRDPLMDFIGQEAERGKVVIGNCNGAQILVESGLIPLGKELMMSLARNAVHTKHGFHAPGFLSEWVWITPRCAADRCATSNWKGPTHLPIAHGEGRFTTLDKDLFAELQKQNQIAFSYCDEQGIVSEDIGATPNGSMYAAAGICNAAGNVVALMPHPERTDNGNPYFTSVREWIESGRSVTPEQTESSSTKERILNSRKPKDVELFIETIITNNEERTVEQTARQYVPSLTLKQWKYLSVSEAVAKKVLTDLTIFNPNKERAYIRKKGSLMKWDAQSKREEAVSDHSSIFSGILLLRRDVPDTGAESLGKNAETGVCYGCSNVSEQDLLSGRTLEVFSNPHASTLEKLL